MMGEAPPDPAISMTEWLALMHGWGLLWVSLIFVLVILLVLALVRRGAYT